MEQIVFYRADEDRCAIATHYVDAMAVLPYLEGKDFKIRSISTIDGSKESEVEFEKCWIRKDHHYSII